MRNPIATFIIGLAIGLVIAGGTFFGGINMGQAQAQEQQQQFFRQRGIDPSAAGGQFGGAGGQFGGAGGQGAGRGAFGGAAGGTIGTISKIDGNTLTLTTPNAGDVTVTVAANAPITLMTAGKVGDLKVGQRITVRGDRSGNNLAATGITEVPDGVNFGGGRANRTPPAGAPAP